MAKTDWLENDHWLELAKQRKVRLPRHETALTTGGLQHWLTKLGISNTQFREWCGNMSLKQYIEKNDWWTLRATVGLLLEMRETSGSRQAGEEKRALRTRAVSWSGSVRSEENRPLQVAFWSEDEKR